MAIWTATERSSATLAWPGADDSAHSSLRNTEWIQGAPEMRDIPPQQAKAVVACLDPGPVHAYQQDHEIAAAVCQHPDSSLTVVAISLTKRT